MKFVGIILIVVALGILLIGIISPVNVLVCSLISTLLFVIYEGKDNDCGRFTSFHGLSVQGGL